LDRLDILPDFHKQQRAKAGAAVYGFGIVTQTVEAWHATVTTTYTKERKRLAGCLCGQLVVTRGDFGT